MGFDLYGINPKIKEGTVKPTRPDWTNCSEAERDEYFEELSKFENENKGYYFRNNVWWWRPLATYVINHSLCIEKKDIDGWHHNDGLEVNQKTAEQIAKQLYHLLNTGAVKKYEDEYNQIRKNAEKHNEKVIKKFKELEKQVEIATGKKDVAPADYPDRFKKEWDKLWEEKDFRENYPFAESNVREFADFCKDSGGFTIC